MPLRGRSEGFGLGGVLVANHGHDAKLHNATERVSGNIGTARVVANVFREDFFATVWSRDARLNRYSRNGVPPRRIPLLSSG